MSCDLSPDSGHEVIPRWDLIETVVDGRTWTVPDLLAAIMDGAHAPQTITREHCGRFVAGGIAALERVESIGSWVQVGLVPGRHARSALYARLAEVAGELLADSLIHHFFLMHKAPGLRVRFHVDDPARRAELVGILGSVTRAWQQDGLVGKVVPGVYEPENHLFGGVASMRHVHRLFTVDTLAWLAFHSRPDSGSSWAYSLVLLRSVLAGVGIVGWEDLDIWERIQRQTGRRLPGGMDEEKIGLVAATIRAVWADPRLARSRLSPAAAELADSYGELLCQAAREWRDVYFQSAAATIGPREAVAFLTIFHWNRGSLPMSTQALVTAALADRSVRP